MQLSIDKIIARKVPFVLVFFVVFSVSYGALYALDYYPEPPTDEVEGSESQNETNHNETEDSRLHLEAGVIETETSPDDTQITHYDPAPLPNSIHFPTLDRTVPVSNPVSRTITELDKELLNGAVRHPDSATFTNEGTIFILGHSSYLPNVLNKNFQAFNGIQHLKWGDTIELHSKDATYVYRVEKVYQAKASEVTVPIAGTGPKLVIATCDSFASKDDRYMVEATLIRTDDERRS